MSINRRVFENAYHLQTLILCEREHGVDVVGRELIMDTLDHVSKKPSFTYVFSTVFKEGMCVMRYDYSDNTWSNHRLDFRGHEFYHVYPLSTRSGDLLLISDSADYTRLVNLSGDFSIEECTTKARRKTMVAVQCGDVAYLFSKDDASVCTFDISTGIFTDWKKLPAFPKDIFPWWYGKNFDVVATNSCIFFFIGKHDNISAKGYRYCCSTEKISVTSRLPHHVALGWACCLMNDDNIIFTGGKLDQPELESSSACFVYNTKKNSWINIASMNTPRRSHAITRLPNGDIMVIGGYIDGSLFHSYEIYNQDADKWTLFEKDLGDVNDVYAITI